LSFIGLACGIRQLEYCGLMNDFYVYIYFRLNGVPCYVGKGRGYRWAEHEYKRSSNPILARIIEKAGRPLPKIKVREGLSNEEAIATEIAFIAAIGREHVGGPLVNLTDGGTNNVGRIDRESSRAKRNAANRGRKRTPEQCARMAAAHLGKALTPEHAAKIGAALRGKAKTPEHAANISRGKLGTKASPELRVILREAHLRPETREKQRQLTTAMMADPQVRAKLSAKIKETTNDPAWRAAHSLRMKAAYERRAERLLAAALLSA
jgi:hypothetical protein